MSKTIVTVTIDGQRRIGTLEDNVFTGTTSPTLEGYLCAREMGQLQTTIIGELGNINIEPLSPEAAIELARLKSLLKLARKQVKPTITVDIFSKLAGKK